MERLIILPSAGKTAFGLPDYGCLLMCSVWSRFTANQQLIPAYVFDPPGSTQVQVDAAGSYPWFSAEKIGEDLIEAECQS
jgi:hypothetical protein